MPGDPCTAAFPLRARKDRTGISAVRCAAAAARYVLDAYLCLRNDDNAHTPVPMPRSQNAVGDDGANDSAYG